MIEKLDDFEHLRRNIAIFGEKIGIMEHSLQYIKWLRVPDISHNLRSIGSGLILARRLPENVLGRRPFKMNHHMLLVCRKGSIRGIVNGAGVSVGASDIMLAVVNQLLQFEDVSPDFEGFIVLVSPQFIKAMEIKLLRIFPLRVLSDLRNNPGCPVIRIQKDKLNTLVSYFNLMFRIMTDSANPNRPSATAHLLNSFLIEAGYFIAENPKEFAREQRSPIVSQFLSLVAQDHFRHRELSYYAGRLSLSESQMYRIIKGYSGKSAREWIEEYTIAEAKNLLVSSGLTIQQISERLNFPSQSFFGKYFKRLSGVSPSEYRKGH